MSRSSFSHNKRQSGFTLVEIAIVLVIIGLILGGVLQGQSLIDNARYKNFSKQIDGLRAAILTFQDQYRGLPGDLLDVSALNVAATPGNGTGLIGNAQCNVAGEESCLLWSHLRYAGLITGDPTLTDGTANIRHSYGGAIASVGWGTQGNGINQHKIWVLQIPGDVAQRYDNEFDDGDASSGNVSNSAAGGATYNLTTNHTILITL